MKYKTLIAVMVVGLTASLSTVVQGSDKRFHQRCNDAWDNSPLIGQGCKAHKINYDHISEGGHYLMCFFNVYCHDGDPHIKGGHRKGVAKEQDLKKFRRCKDNPGHIRTDCTPLEYPYYAGCKAEFKLSSASSSCPESRLWIEWYKPTCKIHHRCDNDGSRVGYSIQDFNYYDVRKLWNCNGRLHIGGC